MNLITKLKLLSKLNSTANAVEDGIKMKNATKVIVAILALLTSVVEIPEIRTSVISAVTSHPALSLALVGLAKILLTLFQPSADTSGNGSALSPMLVLMIAFGLLAAAPVSAQSAPGTDPNIYAAGVSYSVNASPAIAGTGLFAHCFTDSGTCAYTTADMVPNTLKPFTVTSNIGVGVAQKVLTLGKMPVYCVTGAGPSWTGTNVGWQYNGGCLGAIAVKGLVLFPTVRFLKSSVSNGSGYQPIIGIMLGKTF